MINDCKNIKSLDLEDNSNTTKLKHVKEKTPLLDEFDSTEEYHLVDEIEDEVDSNTLSKSHKKIGRESNYKDQITVEEIKKFEVDFHLELELLKKEAKRKE